MEFVPNFRDFKEKSKQLGLSEQAAWLVEVMVRIADVIPMVHILERKLEFSDIQPMLQKLEELDDKPTKNDLLHLQTWAESQFASQENFMELSRDYQRRVLDKVSCDELVQAIGVLSSQVDGLKAALRAMATKLDADATAQNAAVTGSQLDVDYAATLEEDLV